RHRGTALGELALGTCQTGAHLVVGDRLAVDQGDDVIGLARRAAGAARRGRGAGGGAGWRGRGSGRRILRGRGRRRRGPGRRRALGRTQLLAAGLGRGGRRGGRGGLTT